MWIILSGLALLLEGSAREPGSEGKTEPDARSDSDTVEALEDESSNDLEPSTVSESTSDEENLWARGELSLDIEPTDFDIPVVINDDVIEFLKFFTGPGRSIYAHWMLRAPDFRPEMYAILSKKDVPLDLVYLSMIESGYTIQSYSHASAVGLWQFIPSTARIYGLEVGRWIDERLDPAKSTAAAATMLAELFERYDDWFLAWAAYNCGPLCVDAAIREAKSDDYWTLVDKRLLPLETREYVPKLLAAAIIGKHPVRYGFTDIVAESRAAPIYPALSVDASIGLEVLADCFKITPERLAEINPHLLLFELPPDGSAVSLRIPRESRSAMRCIRLVR